MYKHNAPPDYGGALAFDAGPEEGQVANVDLGADFTVRAFNGRQLADVHRRHIVDVFVPVQPLPVCMRQAEIDHSLARGAAVRKNDWIAQCSIDFLEAMQAGRDGVGQWTTEYSHNLALVHQAAIGKEVQSTPPRPV